jgi:hypothetical protein
MARDSDFRLYELLKNGSRLAGVADASNLRPKGLAQSLASTFERYEVVVEDDGIEPTTPCLQSRCSPS